MTSEWRPHPGQQTKFLSSPAFEALFGGAAGPGKTECLVMEALRQIWHPKYTGIIFRRTFPMLEAARGIIQRSLEWYPAYGGKYNDQKHYWKFPSGARIYFGHMQYLRDMLTYQSAEFSFVGFDELTEFEEQQYLYMFTRCRRPAGSHTTVQIGGKLYPPLRAYVRSASNPGNIGHRWVKKRFITRDIVNQLRYFATIENEDTEVDRSYIGIDGTPDALSRAFYPAKLSDNPSADPNYHQRIRASGDPVRVAQLIGGDWDAEHRDGLIYDTWAADINITADADYNPDLPVYWGCDDGYVYGDGPGSINYHPRTILIMQDNALGGLNVIHEYLATAETHEETLTAVLALPYRRPSVAYVDGSAAMFRGELTKVGISTVNATHRVAEGIKAMRQNLPMLRVHSRCQHTIYEFSEYRSDPKGRSDGGEIVPMKIDDHCMDALRYVTYNRRHHLRGNG